MDMMNIVTRDGLVKLLDVYGKEFLVMTGEQSISIGLILIEKGQELNNIMLMQEKNDGKVFDNGKIFDIGIRGDSGK